MYTVLQEAIEYAQQIGGLEFAGLVFGLLCVYFLIKENILTFITGIIYVLISFVVFWQARLYGDFILHIFFLVLNIYGWYAWVKGDKGDGPLHVSTLSIKNNLIVLGVTAIGVILFAQFLISLPSMFPDLEPAALPYWDSTTSILSVTGMWLTARKKIENWYYWLLVDIIATGVYYYKGIHFYSLLYLVYIGMAIAGYLAWRKSLQSSTT